jgi:hypothetical protein
MTGIVPADPKSSHGKLRRMTQLNGSYEDCEALSSAATNQRPNFISAESTS